MFGVKSHPQYSIMSQGNPREKLDSLKGDVRKFDALVAKQNEYEKKTNDKIEQLEGTVTELIEGNARFHQIEDQITELQKFLYGNPEDEEELKKIGYVENNKNNLQQLRDEYIELIGQYVENSTPRQDRERFEQLEKRVMKLEEKPKFEVKPSKIHGFDKVTKK